MVRRRNTVQKIIILKARIKSWKTRKRMWDTKIRSWEIKDKMLRYHKELGKQMIRSLETNDKQLGDRGQGVGKQIIRHW